MRRWTLVGGVTFAGMLALSLADEGVARGDATSATAAADRSLTTEIAEVLTRRHVAGASLALVRQDGPWLVTGIGMADVEADQLATRDTLFRVASISKIFAALSILALAEEGRLTLETPIRELVPEIETRNPWEASSPVRVAHLLENTTGWDDLRPHEFAHPTGEPWPVMRALADDPRSRTSRWPPGTMASYCNSGPAVAAAIVEKVTGRPYETFVRERFFDPLRMPRATFLAQGDRGSRGRPRAKLYGPTGEPLPDKNVRFRASAGLEASAAEMAHLLSFFLQNSGRFMGSELLSFPALLRMETPSTTNGARASLLAGYGLASQAIEDHGYVWRGHRGGFLGASADLFYQRTAGVGYFVALNGDDDEAFDTIGRLVRSHLLANAPAPPGPTTPAAGADPSVPSGFYEVANPRYERTRGLRALFDLAYVESRDDGLLVRAREGHPSRGNYTRVSGALFRREHEITPSLVARSPTSEASLETPELVLRRIPTWLGLMRVAGLLFVFGASASAAWIGSWGLVSRLRARFGRKAPRGTVPFAIDAAPLVAVSSLGVGLVLTARTDILRLGVVSGPSVGIFVSTVTFALATLMTTFEVVRMQRNKTPGGTRARRIHSFALAAAFLLTTTYLAYWGFVGIRTWD